MVNAEVALNPPTPHGLDVIHKYTHTHTYAAGTSGER